ncbi:MAG TPA: TIGR02266 family protein [Archangium sp.]|uniref:TIGR02266 family protein n=1 Tax=Archangium sp. TaxID=1872627 RepID=UPI002E30108B|nr:TIGR02266 family protein [Archangium sp.]HEX5750867.1 TIGR02266 family protein [Archangium sp.]
MNAPSPAPTHPPSRETELARAESELASQEAKLGEQLTRAATEAETLSRRLMELRQQVERLMAERPGDEHVRGAGTRLESASVHTGITEEAREQALASRSEALEARRRAVEDSQRTLNSLQQLNVRAQQELAEAEAGLKRSAEAAARAQREREAAERAQRAREAPPARAAARPAKAQGNTTQLDPHPQGARSRPRMVAAIDQRSDSNFFTGFTTNITEGGIFVATVQSVPRGTTVDLDVLLPGTRSMTVTGVVRWTREVNDKTPELMPGLGVKFSYLPPEVSEVISDFVATREPMFFPD